MRKLIILLLCCGMLISMIGCGGNTDPPPTKSPPITVSKTITTEIPTETTVSVTTAEPTEKEKEPTHTENKAQATEPTVSATEPAITAKPTETTKPSAEENTEPKQETQPSRRDFFIVANSIIEWKLKLRDFAVYCCLLRHADIVNHTCFPSRRLISKECQIDKKTVDVALNSLIDVGLIRKITRTRFDGSKTSNLYHVVDLTKINSE